MIKDNIYKILAVAVTLIGIPTAFLLVKAHYPFWHVIFGIILDFIVVGFFIWVIDKKNEKWFRPMAIIIWCVGVLAGFLTGYRLGNDTSVPWRWTGDMALMVYIGPHIEWLAAIIPWIVFVTLGVILWIIKTKRTKKGRETING